MKRRKQLNTIYLFTLLAFAYQAPAYAYFGGGGGFGGGDQEKIESQPRCQEGMCPPNLVVGLSHIAYSFPNAKSIQAENLVGNWQQTEAYCSGWSDEQRKAYLDWREADDFATELRISHSPYTDEQNGNSLLEMVSKLSNQTEECTSHTTVLTTLESSTLEQLKDRLYYANFDFQEIETHPARPQNCNEANTTLFVPEQGICRDPAPPTPPGTRSRGWWRRPGSPGSGVPQGRPCGRPARCRGRPRPW